MSQQTATTKERILAAACRLFAKNGYAKTTTQEICAEADANIAGVNYHFGGKENLYREVWGHLDKLSVARWQGVVDETADPETQLRQFVRMRVEAALTDGPAGYMAWVIHGEMGAPSPLHEELIEAYVLPKRREFIKIIGSITGDEIDDKMLHMAGFCIHSPLIHLLEIRSKDKDGRLRPSRPKHRCLEEDPELLIETIVMFALAGLKELVQQPRN
jgi:AcrR family transcriptional regulator